MNTWAYTSLLRTALNERKQFLSAHMDRAFTAAAVSYQGVIKMFWLHFRGVVMLSIFTHSHWWLAGSKLRNHISQLYPSWIYRCLTPKMTSGGTKFVWFHHYVHDVSVSHFEFREILMTQIAPTEFKGFCLPDVIPTTIFFTRLIRHASALHP